jgi:hypothetical protein
MPIALSRSAQALAAFLAVAVGLFSLRYLLPEVPIAAPDVVANPFAGMALPIHAGLGAMALILGPFQFIRRRDGRRGRWHRVTGALYMGACLLSAPAGLLLALGSTKGPIATAGFGLLAVAWFWTTSLGLRAVLAGRYAEHGRWMARSFALTFAAVTLRLYMPLGAFLPVDGEDAYRAIAFLCWVPNLLMVELWLSSRPRAAAGR